MGVEGGGKVVEEEDVRFEGVGAEHEAVDNGKAAAA